MSKGKNKTENKKVKQSQKRNIKGGGEMENSNEENKKTIDGRSVKQIYIKIAVQNQQ